MRMGSVSEQLLPYKHPDGAIRRRGPYLTYTFKQGGKTRGKHLRNQEEAGLYRRQIEAFRRYQELSTELVQVSQTLADLEAAGDAGSKKNSRS
jgi:ubiquitin